MKIIKLKYSIPGNNKWNYTGIILFKNDNILFLKNAKTHNEKGAAFYSFNIFHQSLKGYYYNGIFCGNVYKLKNWKIIVKNTKRQEALKIFK
jgi:hypothetical protein